SFGLYEGDELIGLSLGSVMHWCTGTEYYIFEFCIKTENQGKGAGTAFLKQVEEYVQAKQITHIFLQTERTVPAYEFYCKNGFTELSDHVSLYKYF
ncbi:MAG: GNAT family N-acetyltransferase, partial [Oscillospiraceae bacterium]|nr:GNAT family N-acetyltransferase [Oscillospiraceae bacterium]